MNRHYNSRKVWKSSRSKRKQTIHRNKVGPLNTAVKASKNILSFLSIPKLGRRDPAPNKDKVKRKPGSAIKKEPTEISRDLINNKTFAPSREGDTKVFTPKKSDQVFSPLNTAKTSLKQSLLDRFVKEKKLQWGFKLPEQIKSSQKKGIFTSILHSINYQLKKYKVFERFNYFMFYSTISALVIFFLYLCFFDTFFLVKDYQVTFAQSSYLSPDDVTEVIDSVKDDKLFGFIPNNQYWYLSSRTLSLSAQRSHPEIQSIQVERKIWPNRAELRIRTEPILVTLGINNSEYWRIGYDGSVVSRDDAGLRQNLVIVERAVTFNKPDATLQDYSFEGDCQEDRINEIQNCLQLNRFWFVVWLWNQLDTLQIDYSKTILPSLFDSDVVIELQSGSRLIFDSGVMSRQVQQERIESVLDSIVGSQVNTGEIVYIDFRQPKKVYLCRVGQACV